MRFDRISWNAPHIIPEGFRLFYYESALFFFFHFCWVGRILGSSSFESFGLRFKKIAAVSTYGVLRNKRRNLRGFRSICEQIASCNLFIIISGLD